VVFARSTYPCGEGRLPFLIDLSDASNLRKVGQEVITMGEMDTSWRVRRRYRLWSEALKREIVAASLAPGASASVVARKYDVNTNLVFTWRQLFGEASQTSRAPQLVPVTAVPEPPVTTPPAISAGIIKIDLPRGYRLRVGRGVKGAALRLVLDALERR